jgi:pilus assembly protein CpaE
MPNFNLGVAVQSEDLRIEIHKMLAVVQARVVLDMPGATEWEELSRRLDQARPDVLLLDVGSLLAPLAETVERIRAAPSPPKIVALSSSDNPGDILAALRAGVNEYLLPPFKEAWKEALDKLAGEAARERLGIGRMERRVIGFLSAKGGCGATTIACHVAKGLRHSMHARTMLLDLDLDAGAIGFLLRAGTRYSVMDAVENLYRLDETLWRALIFRGPEDIHVLRAPGETPPDIFPTGENVQRLLQFTRSQYDWTVVDLGRGLGYLAAAATRELDSLWLVSTFELPALRQAKQLIRSLLDRGYQRERLKLILNRMPKTPPVGIQELEKLLGLPVYFTLSNQYHALMAAYDAGKLLEPDSGKLGAEFAELASKIAGIQPGNEPGGRRSIFGSLFGGKPASQPDTVVQPV